MGQPIVINEEEIGLSMILAVKVAVVEEKTKVIFTISIQGGPYTLAYNVLI